PPHPYARSVWYRFLVNKVPIQPLRVKIGRSSSFKCVLCSVSFEDLAHFALLCPPKMRLWFDVLECYYPGLSFFPDQLTRFLFHLIVPPLVLDVPRFFTICGTALHNIWLAHWRFVVHDQPFLPARLLGSIRSQVDIILTSPTK
ncbi:uncharacterized protein BX664DRAFT_260750, partial [Halteromyces radiatus]|uniref:uncharacterized protein n=1 Tax=Halteromyces radiatus TaxID=101107 RepID=UPI00221ED4AD